VALAAARRRAQPHSKAEAVSAEHNSVWQPAHRGFEGILSCRGHHG